MHTSTVNTLKYYRSSVKRFIFQFVSEYPYKSVVSFDTEFIRVLDRTQSEIIINTSHQSLQLITLSVNIWYVKEIVYVFFIFTLRKD